MELIKHIFRWIDKYTATVAAIGIGLFFLYHELQRPSLNSENDLIEIKGKITNYSFKHESGYRATLKKYYIWLDQYPCTFQIKADFLPFFYKNKFEHSVKVGDDLKLTFPKDYKIDLTKKDKFIFVTSVSNANGTFLQLENTLEKENDNFDIYAGLFFIMGGLVYYVLKRNKIVK